MYATTALVTPKPTRLPENSSVNSGSMPTVMGPVFANPVLKIGVKKFWHLASRGMSLPLWFERSMHRDREAICLLCASTSASSSSTRSTRSS